MPEMMNKPMWTVTGIASQTQFWRVSMLLRTSRRTPLRKQSRSGCPMSMKRIESSADQDQGFACPDILPTEVETRAKETSSPFRN
eukprot:2231599-Karenia_brevis.AAC.1